MRTPLALSESAWVGGMGCYLQRSSLAQRCLRASPGYSACQLKDSWAKWSPAPCVPRQHGALLGVYQTPWALCAAAPSPVVREGGSWGCFSVSFSGGSCSLSPVAPANPLSAFSAALLSCLSRFLFFNFLH